MNAQDTTTYLAYAITAEDVAEGYAAAESTQDILIQESVTDYDDYGQAIGTTYTVDIYVETAELADDDEFRYALLDAGWWVESISHESGQTTATVTRYEH